MSTPTADDYAAVAAGMREDTPAGSTDAHGPDAELIRLCDRLVALRAEEEVICASDEWAPDRGPYKARYDALVEEHHAINARLTDLPELVTAAGARAMARAALSVAVRDSDGGIICDYTAEWLAFSVVEFLADQDDKQGGRTRLEHVPPAQSAKTESGARGPRDGTDRV